MKMLHFLYHELRCDESRYTYVTEEASFARQVEFFAERLRSPESLRVQPAITFDDGYRSDSDIALPLLQKHGLAAQFFITAGWTGTRAAYMDWPQVRTLASAGQRIGAHGWSHTLLTHCTEAELDRELRGAREALENGLGIPVTSMSLPGGRADAHVLRACTAAGYTQVFTSAPRAENMSEHPFTIGRVNVRNDASVAWFERLLAVDGRLLRTMERNENLKGTARRVLGDRLYARLWGVLNRQEGQLEQTNTGGAAAS